MNRELADALRRAEVAEQRVIELEMEIAGLRRLTGNVIELRQPVTNLIDARAISRLDIPTYDPNRNMILDPFERPKDEPS